MIISDDCCISVRDCGPLQNPQNGFVEFTSTVIRSRATYTCNKGFLLVGVRVRICRPDGEWSGEEPTCESKSENFLSLFNIP